MDLKIKAMRALLLPLLFLPLFLFGQDTTSQDRRLVGVVKIYLTETEEVEVETVQYDKTVFTMDKLEVIDIVCRYYLLAGPIFRPHEIYRLFITNIDRYKDLYDHVYGYNLTEQKE